MNVQNPYSEMTVASTPQKALVSADVEAQRAIAEVQAMVLMAKKFPRNAIDAVDRVLMECQRPGLAEVALYSYSRGGTEITGPSIRLAECLARNWSNLDAGVKELSNSNGQSEMMSYCVDLENNYRQVKIFTVKHERHTKRGSVTLTDQRDIYEQNSNLAARRLRAVILAVIPGDVIEAAVNQCEQTLKAKADISPEAIKKMVEAFGVYNITKAQIEARIQRKLDSITPAQVIALRKIYNSLKDGMSSPADWFEQPTVEVLTEKPKSGSDALKSALKGRKKESAPQEVPSEKPMEKSEEAQPQAAEMAPDECPNSPGDVMTAEYCQRCASREGCPAWA